VPEPREPEPEPDLEGPGLEGSEPLSGLCGVLGVGVWFAGIPGAGFDEGSGALGSGDVTVDVGSRPSSCLFS
jgi:hypothetical protein